MRPLSKPQPKESPDEPKNRGYIANSWRRKASRAWAYSHMHDHACGRAPLHGGQHGRAAVRAAFLALQHGCASSCTVVRLPFCFRLLFWGSVWPLFFLQLLVKAIFVLKTRRFSLKTEISHNVSIFETKKANLSLSHVDLAWKQRETGIKK